MERLTKRLDDGQAVMRCEDCKASWMRKHGKPMEECTAMYCRNMCKDRLAAYEDTGLMPDKVSALVKDWSDLCTIVGECGGIDRLRELAEADKDGRVVVRPCKIGDVLYRASPSGVVVHRVANMVYRELTSRWYIDTIPNLPYASEELGKTTFLTREEAEKALEAMNDG